MYIYIYSLFPIYLTLHNIFLIYLKSFRILQVSLLLIYNEKVNNDDNRSL